MKKLLQITFDVLDNANEGIFVLDDLKIADVNKRILEIFECNYDEIIGKTPVDFSPEFQYDGNNSYNLAKKYVDRAKNGETHKFIWNHKTYKNNLKDIEVTLSKNKIKGKEYIIAILNDITEKLKTEEKLKKSEKRLKLALKATKDAIYEWDVKTGKAFFSPRYYEMLGYKYLEFTPGFESWEKLLHPDDRDSCIRFMESFINSGNDNYEMEFRLRKKDGNYLWIKGKGTIDEKDENNKPLKIIGVHSDISKRKEYIEKINNLNSILEEKVTYRTIELEKALFKLEEEIQKRKIAEDELNESYNKLSLAYRDEKELSGIKSRFISTISHEYRTPLTVINTSAYILEMLKNSDDEELFKKNITQIRKSVEDMTKLLDDILHIQNKDKTLINVEYNKFDIYKTVNEVVNDSRIINKKKQYIFLNNKLNKNIIKSDEKIIRSIIKNLINNAVKYSKERENIEVEISNYKNNKIAIKVIDNGIGIPKKDINKIFDTFYRAKNVGAEGGSGLGLSIVKNYLDAINGDISVKSVENKGTEFTIYLPIK